MGGAQTAECIRHAAARLVTDLYPFADAAEHDLVIADDIATANSGKTDGCLLPLASHSFASIDGAIVEIATKRPGHHLAHAQRSA